MLRGDKSIQKVLTIREYSSPCRAPCVSLHPLSSCQHQNQDGCHLHGRIFCRPISLVAMWRMEIFQN
ncbi:hypothetical protein AB1N83_010365 [Pleurotus pulmonarius]